MTNTLFIPENFMVPKKMINTLIHSYPTITSEGLNLLTNQPANPWDNDSAYFTSLQQSFVLLVFACLKKVGPDSNCYGIFEGYKRHEIAKVLGCSSKSITQVGNRLNKLGLFVYHENEKKEVTVWIDDMSHMFKKTETNLRTNGYMYLTKSFFEKFVSLKSKHECRLTLSVQLKQDTNTSVNKNKNIDTKFRFSELKNLLPVYCRPLNRLKEFFSKGSTNFKLLNKFESIIDGIKADQNNEYIFNVAQEETNRVYDADINEALTQIKDLKADNYIFIADEIKKVMRKFSPLIVLDYLNNHPLPSFADSDYSIAKYTKDLRIHLHNALNIIMNSKRLTV